MKKIILIILMFISVNVFSQTLTTYYSFKTYPTSINKNIYWYGVNFSRIDSVLHLLATGSTSFDLTAFHSFSGINNFTNGTTFSDSVRMTRLSVDTLTITSGKIDSARIPSTVKIDTAKFAHTDTLTTESVRSVWTFWNIVRCIGVVTFDVSPVFNAAVNFANGITVTGTATFNGDLVPTSWVKTQSSVTKDQYIKDKFVRLPISTSTSAGTVTYALHGIGRTSVRDFDIVIRDDSTGRFAKSGNVGLEGGAWAQGAFSTWGLNDTAVWFRRTANAYNFIGDTAFFHIIYADTTR